MKYRVCDSCIGCGVCEATCPEIFRINESGIAEAIDEEVEEEFAEAAAEACDGCPVGAIEQA